MTPPPHTQTTPDQQKISIPTPRRQGETDTGGNFHFHGIFLALPCKPDSTLWNEIISQTLATMNGVSDDDDDDDDALFEEQIRQMEQMENPLDRQRDPPPPRQPPLSPHLSPVPLPAGNRALSPPEVPAFVLSSPRRSRTPSIDVEVPIIPLAVRPPVDEEKVFRIDGDMELVWGTQTLAKAEVVRIIRDTELEPTTLPSAFIKYLLCLEFIYKRQKDVTFLLTHIYTPPSSIAATMMRIDMNISCLDACTPLSYSGTIYESMEVPIYLDRVDQLMKLTIQAGNVAKLALSYGTEHKPEIMDHMPEQVERELNPQQKLLDFLFQRAGDQRLRRKNAAFYRPRILTDGTHTGFYEYFCEIQDFMFRTVSPVRLHPEEYDALTNKPSTPQQMIHLLSGLPDSRCPFLEKNRTKFSFANGVFDATDASFELYANRSHTAQSTSNFFDAPISDEVLSMDPMNIPTPHFDKILQDQKFDDKARRWMYILCGRLLHEVGSLDDWQVTLYIRGVAGSGKSSILKTMGMMYEAGDVGFMMSDGQPTFCDEHLYDKFIVMAMDLDKRTTFSATRINSMISGEQVSINRKFKTALNETWKPPMILASNAQPPWPDVAGNLMRRFPILTFNHPVRQSDPHLFDKLKQELPVLLVKIARAYLQGVREFGSRSLWDDGILPDMCHLAKKEYLITSNPLAAFLASDYVVFQLHMETDTSEFRRALQQFAKDNGDRRAAVGAINRVDHGHLFSMYGCTLVDSTNPAGVVRTVVQGLSIVDVG
jgi:hypothetical protein